MSETSSFNHTIKIDAARGSLDWLVAIMARLLAPDGCPWDREQTLASLRPFLLEEAYEVLDALDEGDRDHHAEELGDLLFQIVFQAALAGTALEEVITRIGDKLIRRHPHVFGEVEVTGSEEVVENWQKIKERERGSKRGLLEGLPRAMPALARAHALAGRAAKVGFDWPDLPSVRGKVAEELGELEEASANGDSAAVAHEAGDLLFAVAQLVRKHGLDPEETLRAANTRFEQRFGFIEEGLAARGRTPAESSLEEMDELWDQAKRALEGGGR